MKRFKYMALAAAILAGAMHSCTKDVISFVRGSEIPQPGNGKPSVASLRSKNQNSQGNMMKAFVWDTYQDALYVALDRPAQDEVTVRVAVDNSRIDNYNLENGFTGTMEECKPFPAENISISDQGTLTAQSGKIISSQITVSIDVDGINPLLHEKFLIPVVIQTVQGAQPGNEVFYYKVQAVRDDHREVKGDFEPVYVGYVNTEKVKPEVANQFHISCTDISTNEETYYKFFDIVNLNVAQIRYETTTGLPRLYLNNDISYVLSHHEKYIKPLQDQDRKVCLVVKGGNEGIGPCNMNKIQRDDLVFQIKNRVEKSKLDGVNIWDEGAGYGRDGTPQTNEASYALFIKALREAMPDKLITVVDVGEPTANFNVQIQGVKVGELIDYAWHGYLTEIVNPWQQGQKRKPISGLEKKQYGGIILPIISINELAHLTPEVKDKLIGQGLDNVFVFSDIPVFTHQMEGETGGSIYNLVVNDIYDTIDWETFTGLMYGVLSTTKFGEGGYTGNIWEKDW